MEVHIFELGVFLNLIGCQYRHHRTMVFQWTARNCPCIGAARERHHQLHLPQEDLAALAFFSSSSIRLTKSWLGSRRGLHFRAILMIILILHLRVQVSWETQ